MISDLDALLASIATSPEDAARHAALADYLQERPHLIVVAIPKLLELWKDFPAKQSVDFASLRQVIAAYAATARGSGWVEPGNYNIDTVLQAAWGVRCAGLSLEQRDRWQQFLRNVDQAAMPPYSVTSSGPDTD
jgi:hypothetical protein